MVSKVTDNQESIDHTPEPWMVRDLPSKWQIATDADELGGLALAIIDMNKSESPTPGFIAARLADLNRIVACVNACAGIPTEDLERASSFEKPHQRLHTLSSFASAAGFRAEGGRVK